MKVLRTDGEWREWHNADGNDIRWVMADAEAATDPPPAGTPQDDDPPDRRDRPRWRP